MVGVNPIAPTGFYNSLSSRPVTSISREQQSVASTQQTGAAFGVTDVVSLSPLAQLFFNGFDTTSIGANDNLLGQALQTTGFYLTQAQEEKITEIISNHKGEPTNHETFMAIIKDLAAEGLSPQQLAAVDIVRFFDPFSALLSVGRTQNSNTDFFSNTLSTPLTGFTIPTEQDNINAYLLQILTQWLGLSIVG